MNVFVLKLNSWRVAIQTPEKCITLTIFALINGNFCTNEKEPN
jgi:hypothetical protein